MPHNRQQIRTLRVGKKPKVPDADEGTGQDVLSESSQEVGCGECHHALLVAMGIIFPPECNSVTVESQQSMIVDGNAMRITAKVAKHLRWSAESRFCVNDPVLLKQTVNEDVELFWVMKVRKSSGQVELLRIICLPQSLHELAAKDATENFDRKEE